MFLKLNLQFFAEGEEVQSFDNWDQIVDGHEADTETVDEQPTEDSEEEVEAEANDDLEASEEETSEEETESDEETEESEEETDSEEEQEESEDEEDDAQSELSDDTEISLGEDKQPVKLKELKDGYLRQSDYTKKTQELAEERKEVESQKEALEPTQKLDTFLQENPWLSEQINRFVDEFKNTGAISLEDALQDAQHGQYINHLMSKNKELENQLKQVNDDYSETKFNSEFNELASDLKNEYSDVLDDEYLETLRQKSKDKGFSIEELKEIADGQLAKKQLEKEREESKKAVARSKKKQKEKKLPPQPKPKGQTPSQAKETPSGWGDLFGLDD